MADVRRDPRLTPARGDIAARHLKGQVPASRYVDGDAFEIAVPLAPLTATPSDEASLLTQALMGERITIYDRPGNGWAWGQLDDDGYVGWLPDNALRPVGAEPTHRVTALRTFAFPSASIKTPPLATLPLGARIITTRIDESFAQTSDGWFVPARHLGAVGRHERDFVAVAERFVGTPYLWGGRSSLGIDCSGLVQVALGACGHGCARDSDMQQNGFGHAVPLAEINNLRRGDLVFWPGHVAIARDAATFVHANAFHMATAIEPTREAIGRIANGGSTVTAIKRLR